MGLVLTSAKAVIRWRWADLLGILQQWRKRELFLLPGARLLAPFGVEGGQQRSGRSACDKDQESTGSWK